MSEGSNTQFLIYETDAGAIEVQLEKETVWLSQAQLVALFGRDQSVISRHIRAVFKEGELEQKSNMQKMHIAHSDKPVALYSLDVIISVGYRVKSQQGTRFRQWATARLKEHLVQGYTLNRQRFEVNAKELEAAMALLRKTAQSPALQVEASRGLVDIATGYAQTFLLLQRYDEGLLTEPRSEEGGLLINNEYAGKGKGNITLNSKVNELTFPNDMICQLLANGWFLGKPRHSGQV